MNRLHNNKTNKNVTLSASLQAAQVEGNKSLSCIAWGSGYTHRHTVYIYTHILTDDNLILLIMGFTMKEALPSSGLLPYVRQCLSVGHPFHHKPKWAKPGSSALTSGATGREGLDTGRMETGLLSWVWRSELYIRVSHRGQLGWHKEWPWWVGWWWCLGWKSRACNDYGVLLLCGSLVTYCGPEKGPVQKRWCFHFLLFHVLFSLFIFTPLLASSFHCLSPSLCSVQAFLM